MIAKYRAENAKVSADFITDELSPTSYQLTALNRPQFEYRVLLRLVDCRRMCSELYSLNINALFYSGEFITITSLCHGQSSLQLKRPVDDTFTYFKVLIKKLGNEGYSAFESFKEVIHFS